MPIRPLIVVADDLPSNRLLLEDMLSADYRVLTVADGQGLLDLLAGQAADLILLDVLMPGLDGYETCRRLKAGAATREIPVIFLTSLESPTDEAAGLALGAEDFIHKPCTAAVMLARVRTHLALAGARRELQRHNVELGRLVEEQTREVLRTSTELALRDQQVIATQSATITALCGLAEARDNETGNHILRTQHYVRHLAEHLRSQPRFRAALDDEAIALMFRSAPLHDIGKVATPDAVLLKPGKLDAAEWEVMKRHCVAGRDALARAVASLDAEQGGFLRVAMEIAYGHHERWDGSGYPQGLAGEAIPLSARLMAVADVYDALISRRVYKPAFSHERAVAMMAEERGRHFDPDVLDVLLLRPDRFAAIAREYSDDPLPVGAALEPL